MFSKYSVHFLFQETPAKAPSLLPYLFKDGELNALQVPPYPGSLPGSGSVPVHQPKSPNLAAPAVIPIVLKDGRVEYSPNFPDERWNAELQVVNIGLSHAYVGILAGYQLVPHIRTC